MEVMGIRVIGRWRERGGEEELMGCFEGIWGGMFREIKEKSVL